MHKDFYASGFIYHSPTEQILLQQKISTSIPSIWTLFGGLSLYSENAEITFQRIVYEALGVKPRIAAIHPIYEYFNTKMNKNYYILYAEIEKTKNFSSDNGDIFKWFSFKQVLKLELSKQSKHDIVVGERVIDAKIRKDLGMQTLD